MLFCVPISSEMRKRRKRVEAKGLETKEEKIFMINKVMAAC
jgi:hypothetical protein